MGLEGYGPWGCKESNMTVHACRYFLWDFFITNVQCGKSLILKQLKDIKRGSQGIGNQSYVTLITFKKKKTFNFLKGLDWNNS